MQEKKQKLVVDGNALYEIDMECIKNKRERMRDARNNNYRKKRKDADIRKTPGR